jgi:hypothetical protein
MSFLWSEQTATAFLCDIYLLAFTTELESVYYEVRTKFLHIILDNVSVNV